MRTILSLALSILLISHAVDAFASEFPAWFGKLAHAKNDIIGYGVGDSYEQAYINAKNEIAKTILTHVTSESAMDQRLVDGNYSQNIDISVRETTSVVLDSVENLKEERRNGIWYVALKYENIPIEIKFVNKLDLQHLKPEDQNSYLHHTPLIESLNQKVGFQLDYKLLRKNGYWHLAYDDNMMLLDAMNFERLFINYSPPSMSIVPSNVRLMEGVVFSFSIQSSIDGFISLFNVCETGEVFIIEGNRKIKAGERILVPNPVGDLELFAGVIEKGKWTQDLYIAVLTSEKINMGQIHFAMETFDPSERNYKFDELLAFLDQHTFCSVVLSIRPR